MTFCACTWCLWWWYMYSFTTFHHLPIYVIAWIHLHWCYTNRKAWTKKKSTHSTLRMKHRLPPPPTKTTTSLWRCSPVQSSFDGKRNVNSTMCVYDRANVWFFFRLGFELNSPHQNTTELHCKWFEFVALDKRVRQSNRQKHY